MGKLSRKQKDMMSYNDDQSHIYMYDEDTITFQSKRQFQPVMEPATIVCKTDHKNFSKRQEKLHNQQAIMYGYDLLSNFNRSKVRRNVDFESSISSHDCINRDNRESLSQERMMEALQEPVKKRDDLAVLNRFVIKKDSTWKGVFDIVMMFTSCYNIFGNAYYAAFGVPTGVFEILLDTFIEVLFLMDMIFNFCQEYMDEETYKLVSNFKEIAKHYAKKSFIFDFIAWFPAQLFLDKDAELIDFQLRMLRLLRLLRLPRLA